MKIMVLFIQFLSYHLARISALADKYKTVGVEICSANEQSNIAIKQKEKYPFIWETLFNKRSLENILRKEQKNRLINILENYSPDVIMIPGWNHNFSNTALRWAKQNNKITILMSDSKKDDFKRFFFREWLKRRIIRLFDGAIVGGASHKKYLEELGMSSDRIVLGYDVVDNNFIMEKVKKYLVESNRPFVKKYFLMINRFIKRKNISRVLEAYRIYRKEVKEISWDLVLCGCGKEEFSLRKKILKENIGGVHFTGYLLHDDICRYLAFAEVLIHAAYKEQWGLVINEAMAAAKPVLVSLSCGCSSELVRNGENGLLFNPFDVIELANKMKDFTEGKYNLILMGEESQKIINYWNPELFANNISELIKRIKGQ